MNNVNEMFEYWKDDDGRVFAFEINATNSESNLDGLVKLTDDEVENHLNPTPSLWTNGLELREAFIMDLSGWRLATDDEVEEIVHNDAVKAVSMRTAELRSEANYAIAPLQDALDLDEITDDKRAKLIEWKRYRIALSEITEQAGYPTEINWPEKP